MKPCGTSARLISHVYTACIHAHTQVRGGHSTYGQVLDFKIQATKGKMVFEALIFRDPGIWAGETGMFSPGWWGPPGRSPLRRWCRRSIRCSWTVKIHVIAPASHCTWMATCWTTSVELRAWRGCRRARRRVVEGLSGSRAASPGAGT